MAAFTELDWGRFDVWSIVVDDGVTTIDAAHHSSCRAWLKANDYAIDSIDFGQGIGPAVIAFGNLLHWERQFGYSLKPESRNLDALHDGFEFDVKPGKGRALELLGAETALREDSRWFYGLLSIAREYSRNQLALGAKFITYLVLEGDSKVIGETYEALKIPVPFWSARGGDPFVA